MALHDVWAEVGDLRGEVEELRREIREGTEGKRLLAAAVDRLAAAQGPFVDQATLLTGARAAAYTAIAGACSSRRNQFVALVIALILSAGFAQWAFGLRLEPIYDLAAKLRGAPSAVAAP